MNRHNSGLMIFGSACIVFGSALLLAGKEAEIHAVPSVDLKRYQGRWYEIARLPNRFQKKCVSDVTATYSLQVDGKIEVLNTCKKSDGEIAQSTGTARLADKAGPSSKLKVTFFWPFSGDYWVLDIDSDYQRALVGTPNRDYLWILSRTPALAREQYEQLVSRAKSFGFDTAKLSKTRQGM